jgi:hypothetical protein
LATKSEGRSYSGDSVTFEDPKACLSLQIALASEHELCLSPMCVSKIHSTADRQAHHVAAETSLYVNSDHVPEFLVHFETCLIDDKSSVSKMCDEDIGRKSWQ